MSLQSLQKRINLTLSVVALAAFLFIALLTAFKEYRKIRLEYSVAMHARINVARALMQDALFHTDTFVQSILKSHSNNLQELLSHLNASRYFEYHGDSFYVLDPHGKVVKISEPYHEYEGLDFSAMTAETSSEEREVRHYYQSLLTNRSVVIIQYPLNDGYLLVVERSLENFIPLMASFEAGKLFEKELFFVLSSTGQTLYHPNRSFMETRHNLGFDLKDRSLPDTRGIFTFIYQKQKYIALQEQFPEPAGWEVYYCIPTSVLNDTLQKNLSYHFGFLLFFFLLLFLTLRIVFSKYFTGPVGNIIDALENTGEETGLVFSPEASGGIVEFNTIMDAIVSRDKEITNNSERFQTVLDSLDSVVYVADMETYELLFVNSHLQKLSGDVIGRRCYQALQQDQDGPCGFCTNKLLVDADGNPRGVHVWEFQNTGDKQWYECRDQAIRWTDGRLVRMEIATNISARKNAEKALQAEKERLSVTLRSIGDGVITTDMEGRVVFINKVAEELCGWTNEEAVGEASSKIFNIINEKTGQKCASPVQRIIELGRIIGLANHTMLISKDGSRRGIADSGAPIRDKESKIVGVVLVFRDITHERKMEEELLKVRKLESVGVLAGGIAHDFNNILSAILGNIELATYRVAKEDSRTTSLLSNARKATVRAAKLTGQLLTFSKGGDPLKEITSLPELISEAAGFVLHGSQVASDFIYPEDLWMVDVDSGQIGQVIQNITLNAKHAMPQGGTIIIKCANVEDPASESLLSVDKGDYVRINIQDTGVGIPQEVIDKIFDPYFTTKQEGSGLGLAICHSIINKHDGYLTVFSTPGKGTTFTLYLPAVRLTDCENKITEKFKKLPAVKAARIMVMDDEKMLRDVAAAQLSILGHEAILVNDGAQALNKYQELLDDGTSVDIVIMDLTIPGGMGGQEAAEKLLEIDPAAKIIVASGYSNDPAMANYRDYGFSAAVTKPFDLQQLSNAIASIL
ncbi:MAG: PAS domain S-box protein [Thermodesulfobacteriota bacterium]|nr:PAS domain S-box protein [Thermodesulfobacteriota bacterium]